MTRLIAFDMEGCLTDDPTVWELMHRKWGTWDSHGAPYWDSYRAGELEYDEFARMDVAAWAGAPCEMLHESVFEVPMMPGCAELFAAIRTDNTQLAIITNGLVCLAERFRCDLGVQWIYGNVAEASGPRLSGGIDLRVPFAAKGQVLMDLADRLNIDFDDVYAVGDGRADVEMFRVAGTGVAFCPGHPAVGEAADHIIKKRDLRELLPIVAL